MNLPAVLTEVAQKDSLEEGLKTLFSMFHENVNDALGGKLSPELQKEVDACFTTFTLNTSAIAGALAANTERESADQQEAVGTVSVAR